MDLFNTPHLEDKEFYSDSNEILGKNASKVGLYLSSL